MDNLAYLLKKGTREEIDDFLFNFETEHGLRPTRLWAGLFNPDRTHEEIRMIGREAFSQSDHKADHPVRNLLLSDNIIFQIERLLVAQNEATAAILPYVARYISDTILNDSFHFPAIILLRNAKNNFYEANKKNIFLLLSQPGSYLLTDHDGCGSLLVSVEEGLPDAFEFLLKCGADLSLKSIKDKTVISTIKSSSKAEEFVDAMLAHLSSPSNQEALRDRGLIDAELRDLFFESVCSGDLDLSSKLSPWASEGFVQEIQKSIVKNSIDVFEKIIAMGGDIDWVDPATGKDLADYARDKKIGSMIGLVLYHKRKKKDFSSTKG